ncbi:MAG: hypothetical protein HC771_09105 [Synechococcales cyanobacterium CRU_2_2]|nr:hypothetical protein [Synechococcales cyanobacterium CRU_2_2]
MRETGVSPTTRSIAEAIAGEACEAIAYHGWGYDRHFWQPWETLLAQQHIVLKCFDRGYFGSPVQPTFSHSTGRRLILAHSYGLHLCPPELLQAADAVVVFASFVQFHPQEARARRRSQRILQRMIDQCRLDPESVLRAFWETCGHGLKLREQAIGEQTICEQTICEQTTPLLVDDLVALGRSQMNLEDWMRSPQNSPLIILIQGNQDHIVPSSRAPDLLEFWANPNATLIQMDGPHALPVTQSQHCWDACWALLQPVIKPAFQPEFQPTIKPGVIPAPPSIIIAQAFGQAADTYDRHGTAQCACADHLLAFVPTGFLDHLPPGPVLEFGCGTGFLTQGLIARLGALAASKLPTCLPRCWPAARNRLQPSRSRPRFTLCLTPSPNRRSSTP